RRPPSPFCPTMTRHAFTRGSSAKSTVCCPKWCSAWRRAASHAKVASWWIVPSNTYDLIVLGDDLAALVCATLCARRGMRTLVLGDDRPSRYTLGPHKLPIEPALWPVGAANAGDRVLKELHAELAMRRKLREPKLAAQIVAPDLRLDL